jgi:hypothetical protein
MQSALAISLFAALGIAIAAADAHAADLCDGKTKGSITFYDKEISRDAPLPSAPATELAFEKPMFALACLTDAVGPQEQGGNKFRVVLYVDGKQTGAVFRPQLSQSRSAVILMINEDFGDSLTHHVDKGVHKFRLQAASEKPTGRLDATLDLKNEVVYVQELRKAGYLADGTVTVKKAR